MKLEMKISYEEMLFRYGLSCADNLLFLKKISEEEYNELYRFAENKQVPSREFLEKIFSEAKNRIKEKSAEGVDNYFRKEHNKIIDRREGNYSKLTDSQCESCKVFEGKITRIEYKRSIPIYTVMIENKEKKVFGKYLLDNVNIGDSIVIHNYSAVRKL